MVRFICKEEGCKRKDIADDYYSNTYKMVNGSLQSNNAPCPSCGKIREEIDFNKEIPFSQKNIDIAKYSSSSPEQKKAMLKKRSRDHFEKEVKPYKDHRLQEAVKQFKDASK